MKRAIFLALLATGCEGPAGPDGTIPSPTPVAAALVTYDGAPGLSATNVEAALDEIALRTSIALPSYCGFHTNTANGGGANLAGWIAGRTACLPVCGDVQSARVCSVDDVVHLLQQNVLLPDEGWVFSGLGCDALLSNSPAKTGALWTTAGEMTIVPCNAPSTVLCCR